MIPKKRVKKIQPKHSFSEACRSKILNNLVADVDFLKENRITNYEIELTFFKFSKSLEKSYANVYKTDQYNCEI